ncbi:MAG TPA: FAD-dependent oxidoreductase [Pseudonocardiaceae bacterium]|jgi:3-phenylpropionate/trans-cinnamate dioxygenase ferredoxin reductase subunit|nr:FAD-dependent oxidoreductase [Pseudonocardiaceae bacterium]
MTAVLVVGAGQAGVQTAASLRDNGFTGRVVLIGDEPGEPYQRPPLSKAYLAGEAEADRLALRGPEYYAKQGIELIADRVTEIDRPGHRVRLSDGKTLDYAHLVLATGARNRDLPVPGADLDGVFGLRTMADASALRERLPDATNVVVVGGGFIGLEFASVAAKLGHPVTVVEAMDRVLARVATPEVSARYAELHESHGNRILLGATVAALRGEGRVSGVELGEGTVLPADLVLVGIGVRPNTELAAEAGLVVDNGILVDEQLSTSDPDISAIGDCAAYPSRHTTGTVRLESVQNAIDHGRCLANRLSGTAAPYDALPWFWSDQLNAKLQIAGLSTGYDTTVVHGDPAGGRFSVFCFQGERLLAVESVNRPRDHIAARRLFIGGIPLRPQDVRADGFDLKEHLARAA